MRTGLMGLALLATFGLSACMEGGSMVSSVNPLLQSQESRDIRAFLNDATLRHEGSRQHRQPHTGRTVTVDDVVVTEYSRQGTYSRVVTSSVRETGEVFTFAATGSWNVRDDQVCRNEHTRHGQPIPAANQETVCLSVAIDGEIMLTTDRRTGQVSESRRL